MLSGLFHRATSNPITDISPNNSNIILGDSSVYFVTPCSLLVIAGRYLCTEFGDHILTESGDHIILDSPRVETVDSYPTTPIPSNVYKPGSNFNTLTSDFDSGKEQRRRLWRFPKRNFSLVYNYITKANRHLLHEFYREHFGGNIAFWYFDLKPDYWDDEYVGYGGPLPMDACYAADATVFTDETEASNDVTTNDMTLTPAAPAVNDAYYFGSVAPFDKLTVKMGTAGVGNWTITGEYCQNDGTFVALAGAVDGTVGFTAAAGDHDVTYNMPTDWTNISLASVSASPICYWVRARVSAFVNIVTQPKGTSCTTSSKYFDIPGSSVTDDATFITYVDGAVTAHTHVSGGGGGGADRFFFAAYPAQGSLITCDFYGYLRVKGKFKDDSFNEEMIRNDLYSTNLGIQEVQW